MTKTNLIRIDEDFFTNMMFNDGTLSYSLTIPKEYVEKGLNISFTLNGEEIYKQLIKRDEEVRFV